MHREYLRAMRRHGQTWFGGLIGLGTGAAGVATIVIAVFSGLGKLPVWSPAPLAFLVTLGALYPVTYRAWNEEHEKVMAPEPRDSPVWEAHLQELRDYVTRLIPLVHDRIEIPSSTLRESLTKHWPIEGASVEANNRALSELSRAKQRLWDKCMSDGRTQGLGENGAYYFFGAAEAYAYGDDRSLEVWARLKPHFRWVDLHVGGELVDRSDKEVLELESALEEYLRALKGSDEVLLMKVAKEAADSQAWPTMDALGEIEHQHRVPGERCSLCREFAA